MVAQAIKKVCALANMPKERLIFIIVRGFANENILNSLNELGLNHICRVRLDVTVSQEPQKSWKAKKLIREVASETEESRVCVLDSPHNSGGFRVTAKTEENRVSVRRGTYYKGLVPIALVIKRDRAHSEPLA